MVRAKYYQFDISLRVEGNNLILKHATDADCVVSNLDDFIEECEGRLEEEFETNKSQRENGIFILDSLFPQGQPLRDSFTKALEENERVRLRLLYPPDAAEPIKNQLLKIPWEYLYLDPEILEQLSGFLCHRSNFSLVHCLQKPTDKNAFADKDSLPLKVSFLSALDNPDDALVNINRLIADNSTVSETQSSIIRINRLADELQLSDFRNTLNQDEIAQLLIHGGTDAIYFKGADGELNGVEIFEMLNDIAKHKIRTVVLCACEGAQNAVGPSIQLHQRGIPVVIGFTKPFNTKKAIRFMEDFYSELKSTAGSVEAALTFARTGLIQKDDSFFTTIAEDTQLSLDWGIPRIFMSAASGDLISEELLYTPVFKMGDVFETELKRRLDKAPKKVGAPNIPDYPPEIDEWRKGFQRILYLHGASGSGKSTQIARFIDKRKKDPKILYHFCGLRGNQADEENAIHPLVFVRDSLYPQLESLFGREQYRLWVGNHYPYLINNPKDALQQLVIEPLRRARNSSKWKQPVLIIDGLDRVEDSEPGYTILDLLADFIQPLTEVMRLMLTATSDPDQSIVHQRILGLLGENKNMGESLKMPVIVDWQQIQEDIVEKLPDDLKPIFNEFLDKLKNNGPINYQFISFIKRILTIPDLLEKIIRGARPKQAYLNFAYETAWQFIKDQNKDEQDRIERLLNVLGVAYAPLPISMLAVLLAVDEDKISDLLGTISCFTQEESEAVSCEHPSIKHFLESIPFKDNPHKLLLDLFQQQTGNGRSWGQFERQNNQRVVDYAAHYLAEHAYKYFINERKTDFKNGMEEYLNLMLAPGFRNFRKRKVGDAEAIEDVRRILRVYYIKTAIDDFQSEVRGFIDGIIKLLGGKSKSLDNIWKAGNRLLAAPVIEQILDASSPQLIALERKLCSSSERDDLSNPLREYWSLYYPSIFHRSVRTS